MQANNTSADLYPQSGKLNCKTRFSHNSTLQLVYIAGRAPAEHERIATPSRHINISRSATVGPA